MKNNLIFSRAPTTEPHLRIYALRILKSCLTPFCLLVVVMFSGCAMLPDNVERPVSRAFSSTEDTMLARMGFSEKRRHPGQSGFRLLRDGSDAFIARALLAVNAERSLDVQYYLYHDDLTGDLFTDQLLKAADRGVRVRMLIDDMNLKKGDFGAAVLDQHSNIEVRIFNPFGRNVVRWLQYVTGLGSVTRRMHNKSFTADNQVTIVGGRNIGDEYFNASPQLMFSDLDVLAVGPVVQEVSDSFDAYWNSDVVYPASSLVRRIPSEKAIAKYWKKFYKRLAKRGNSEYIDALKDSELATRFRENTVRLKWGRATAIFDRPEKVMHDRNRYDLHMAGQIGLYMEKARNELIIFSPYFVPGKSGCRALEQMVKDGIRVRVLTNSLASTDVIAVHAGYAKYRRRLLRAGVELYELDVVLNRKQRKQNRGKEIGFSKSSLHTKSFVIDRKRVFIGSLNVDPRSVLENTEIGVMLDSPEVAEDMAAWFEQEIKHNAYTLSLERVNRPKRNGGTWENYWRDVVRWRKQDDPDRVYETEPKAGLWRRFFSGLIRLLPVESQL